MYRRFGARGHDRRNGAAADRPRGRGRVAGDPGASSRPRASRSGPAPSASASRRTAGGVAVAVDCADGRPEAIGSHVLLAVGRRPNTDDLGLDKAGVADRRARLHHRRRWPGDQRARHLGARRLQRPRRLHPHRLQRLRDRRRQPARRRAPPGQRPRSGLRALHRSAARPRRHDRGAGPGHRPAAARPPSGR